MAETLILNRVGAGYTQSAPTVEFGSGGGVIECNWGDDACSRPCPPGFFGAGCSGIEVTDMSIPFKTAEMATLRWRHTGGASIDGYMVVVNAQGDAADHGGIWDAAVLSGDVDDMALEMLVHGGEDCELAMLRGEHCRDNAFSVSFDPGGTFISMNITRLKPNSAYGANVAAETEFLPSGQSELLAVSGDAGEGGGILFQTGCGCGLSATPESNGGPANFRLVQEGSSLSFLCFAKKGIKPSLLADRLVPSTDSNNN